MPFSSLAAGFGLGLSLIIAIGAQNLFVLRQGIRREHVFAVAAICALSDLALIVAGVAGIGAALQAVPWLVGVIRWAGAAFLVGYGLLAARRAIRPSGAALVAEPLTDATAPEPVTDAADDAPGDSHSRAASVAAVVATRRTTLATVVLTCLALTWLNPHVYLDTVFLLGSVANTYGDGRWAFAAGAGVASLAWFFGLAYGARLLGGVLGSPQAWRVLDVVIAVVMVTLGVLLVVPS